MKRLSNKPLVTYLIIGLCVCVTLIYSFIPFSGNGTEKAIMMGAYYKPLILSGEWWRIVTCGLIHTEIWHLLMNMFSLYMIGGFTEYIYGKVQMVLILLVSIAGGSLFLLCRPGNTVGLGISGGLYGLMAAYFLYIIKEGGLNNPAIKNNLIEILAINLFINFLPGVAYMAHIGGFVAGLLCALLCLDDPQFKSIRMHCLLSFILLAGMLFYTGRKNLHIPENERYLGTDSKILVAEYRMGFKKHALKMAEKLDDLYNSDYLEIVVLGEKLNDKEN